MWALSTASSSVSAPGRTTAPWAATSATISRSTCSWSNVTTSQRAANARRSSATNGDPSTTSAATAQAASSGCSASTAMDRPSALAASPAMRASWPAPTNPIGWVLRLLAPVRGFA